MAFILLFNFAAYELQDRNDGQYTRSYNKAPMTVDPKDHYQWKRPQNIHSFFKIKMNDQEKKRGEKKGH